VNVRSAPRAVHPLLLYWLVWNAVPTRFPALLRSFVRAFHRTVTPFLVAFTAAPPRGIVSPLPRGLDGSSPEHGCIFTALLFVLRGLPAVLRWLFVCALPLHFGWDGSVGLLRWYLQVVACATGFVCLRIAICLRVTPGAARAGCSRLLHRGCLLGSCC